MAKVEAATAADIQQRLEELQAEPASGKLRMRQLFDLAHQVGATAPDEVERLLMSPGHEARVVAVSILDFQARRAATPDRRRRELYELYLRRHDWIDTWDLVDRAAPYVVGGYLSDRPRDPLYELARSTKWYERRTAIVSTWFFIRKGDLDDTFAIAEILADDAEELVQKAVGGWVREAGKRDQVRLRSFLDRHAATMPRVSLRYAIENLEQDVRRHYLDLKSSSRG